GGRGVADLASPMARARVNCIACHAAKKTDGQVAEVTGQTFLATQERCDYCHGDKYAGMLADWKKNIATRLTVAESALLETQRALATAKAKGSLSAENELKINRLLDDAEFNIRYVKLAHGVHNPTYATALLNVSLERCRDAQSLLTGAKLSI